MKFVGNPSAFCKARLAANGRSPWQEYRYELPAVAAIYGLVLMMNLFRDLPNDLPEELIDVLARGATTRVERIVSKGHTTPGDEWYDQEWDEWVLLLTGKVRLVIEGQEQPLEMSPGDHVVLPAHQRHRVEWTAPGEHSVWLAVHFVGT